MSIADFDVFLSIAILALAFGVYWLFIARAMEREIREMQDESAAPEGWDAVRRIEQERRE